MEEADHNSMCTPRSERYIRQLRLIGVEGQEKLGKSTVLIAGLGGLGSITSMYLAAAGVGRLVLVDSDVVEIHNLNRQLLYDEASLGLPKPYLAARRVRSINSCVETVPVYSPLNAKTIPRLLDEYKPDLVVDGLDNWETRLLLDEEAWKRRIPLVHAAVEGYYGQLMLVHPPHTARLKSIAPSEYGRRCIQVVGAGVGVIASLEALLALRALLGDYSPAGTLYVVDMKTLEINKIPLKPGGEPISPDNTAK